MLKSGDKERQEQVKREQEQLAKNFTQALLDSGIAPGVIAGECEVTEQAVSNWKRTGKIRKGYLPVIARLTGWTVHRLLTGEKEPPPAPPADFADPARREPTPSEWAVFEDIREAMMMPSLARRVEEIRREVRELSEYADRKSEALKRQLAETATVAPAQPARPSSSHKRIRSPLDLGRDANATKKKRSGE